MNMERINEMVEAGKLKMLHTAWAQGYISRKIKGKVEVYSGKFGEGFKVHTSSKKSTRYHYVTYYVFA